jgi:hypothetical protein
MKETYPDGRSTAQGGGLHFVLRQGLPLERETGLFVLASAMDLMLTWLMLNYDGAAGHVQFVESNFVARYFLYSWGFDGLVGFKFVTVALVAVICQIIARHRIDVARRLLTFATLVVIAVVFYSAALLVRHT